MDVNRILRGRLPDSSSQAPRLDRDCPQAAVRNGRYELGAVGIGSHQPAADERPFPTAATSQEPLLRIRE